MCKIIQCDTEMRDSVWGIDHAWNRSKLKKGWDYDDEVSFANGAIGLIAGAGVSR